MCVCVLCIKRKNERRERRKGKDEEEGKRREEWRRTFLRAVKAVVVFGVLKPRPINMQLNLGERFSYGWPYMIQCPLNGVHIWFMPCCANGHKVLSLFESKGCGGVPLVL
jgi:hypothetical protein